MLLTRLVLLAAALTLAAASGAAALPTTPAPPDYADPSHWLCLAGRDDACRTDLSSTILDARGRARIQAFATDPAPPVDCFYVYPTVSEAPGVSAPIAVTEAECRAVRQQFARFASVCRLYAPLYRQMTFTAMRRLGEGAAVPGVPEALTLAVADIRAAWKAYMTHHNSGRGVVLIGHSQGANLLREILAEEIDAKPLQRQLVSAILPGAHVEVAQGRDLGGAFKTILACRSRDQLGCVIAFGTWRASSPPPPDFWPEFPAGQEALCVNPAALAGGVGELHPYLSATGETILPAYAAEQTAWTDPPRKVATPFVQLPGLLAAECRRGAGGAYLAVELRRRERERRTGKFIGDVVIGGKDDGWGLHLVDLNLPAGDLIALVRSQAAAYVRQRAGRASAPIIESPQEPPMTDDPKTQPEAPREPERDEAALDETLKRVTATPPLPTVKVDEGEG